MGDYASSFWYVQLYTENSSNINYLTDFNTLESDIGDGNNDGDTLDSLGGYLIDPAQVYGNYYDDNNNKLAPSYYGVGDSISDYYVINNPSNDLSLYYHAGQSVTIAPINISGYITPESYTQVLRQGLGLNVHNFLYSPIVSQPTQTKDITKLVEAGNSPYPHTAIATIILVLLFVLNNSRWTKKSYHISN